MKGFLTNPPPLALLALALAVLIVLWFRMKRADFLTLVITVGVMFGIAEGLARWRNIGNPGVCDWSETLVNRNLFKYAYATNSALTYTYPDNPRGYFDSDNQVVGHINSLGFRGTETVIAKPAGRQRIVMLGDSFTLGIGVKDGDTLAVNLQTALLDIGSNVEVLNFGVSGSSTKGQVRLLREYALQFAPDVVILTLFLNDAERRGTIEFMSRATFFARVRNHSFFLNALIGGVEKLVMHKDMVQHYRDGYADSSPGWQEIRSALKEARALADEHGFRFGLFVYPVLIQLGDVYPFKDVNAIIGEFCAENGIIFGDLTPFFDGQDARKLWVHRTDQHPNEVANPIAARGIAELLLSQ
jgi:lysophospholipase L1-like esterase